MFVHQNGFQVVDGLGVGESVLLLAIPFELLGFIEDGVVVCESVAPLVVTGIYSKSTYTLHSSFIVDQTFILPYVFLLRFIQHCAQTQERISGGTTVRVFSNSV